MTEEECAEVSRLIELATETGKARHRELMRCVDVVLDRAKQALDHSDREAADLLFGAARAMLDG